MFTCDDNEVGIVFGRDSVPILQLRAWNVSSAVCGHRADGGISELTLKIHIVIDDMPLEGRHLETALIISTWATSVLPKI